MSFTQLSSLPWYPFSADLISKQRLLTLTSRLVREVVLQVVFRSKRSHLLTRTLSSPRTATPLQVRDKRRSSDYDGDPAKRFQQ